MIATVKLDTTDHHQTFRLLVGCERVGSELWVREGAATGERTRN